MQKKLFCAFALLAVQLALADFTPHDEAEASGNCREGYLFAAGSGKTSAEAKKNAIIEIGNKVFASVETEITITRSQHEKDGIPFDSNSYLEMSKIVSKLANANAVKEISQPKPKGGELYEFKGYMCNSDAAAPYLNSLREQAGRLKTAVSALGGKSGKKTAWSNAVSIYKTLKDLEIVIKALGQIDHALKKEYEADYARAKEEYTNSCQNSKLHWMPERESGDSKIAFKKLAGYAEIDGGACKGKGIKLIYKNIEPSRNCGTWGSVHGCSYAPSVSIASCSGDAKYPPLQSGKAVEGNSNYGGKREDALKDLLKNLEGASFWEEWGQEIKKWRMQCE